MNTRGPFGEILVALDGSAGSQSALDRALALGVAFRSRLHLLHVIPRLDEYARFADLLRPVLAELSKLGDTIVAEAAAAARQAGVAHEVCIRQGAPAMALTEYALETGVDLIVMGSRGLGAKPTSAMGSVSYQVAMRAPASVLVVRGATPFDRILLAHDGSDDARRAADCVVELAPRFGSRVTLTFIVPARPGGAFTLAGSPVEPFLLEVEERLRKERVPVSRDLRYGHPAEELLKSARQHTLVAFGARGRSDLALDYVGGVADKILRNSPASTLLVR